MAHTAAHADAHSEAHYWKVWGILLVLLVISIFGPFLGIQVVTLITAFGIAIVKAYMVAKNFMHLDVEKRIIQWTLAVAVVIMAMLFAGVSPDVMHDTGHRWKKDEGFHPVEVVDHHAAEHGAAEGRAADHEAMGGASAGHEGAATEGTHTETATPEDSTSDGH